MCTRPCVWIKQAVALSLLIPDTYTYSFFIPNALVVPIESIASQGLGRHTAQTSYRGWIITIVNRSCVRCRHGALAVDWRRLIGEPYGLIGSALPAIGVLTLGTVL